MLLAMNAAILPELLLKAALILVLPFIAVVFSTRGSDGRGGIIAIAGMLGVLVAAIAACGLPRQFDGVVRLLAPGLLGAAAAFGLGRLLG